MTSGTRSDDRPRIDDGTVHLRQSGPVAHVTFDRPAARNAMTLGMYAAMDDIVGQIGSQPEIRVAVFRGAGGAAFVAGTDIGHFADFRGAEDGIAYERQMDAHLGALRSLPIPALAVVEGPCVGGGLGIACACDIRIATPEARFGVPIARTIGNCLSMATMTRLLQCFGEGPVRRMLLLGELLSAQEALDAGFLSRIVPADDLDAEAQLIADRLAGNAPLTLRASKEAIRRIESGESGDGADLIRSCYGSDDFRAGVTAFLGKTKPKWTGE